MSAVLRYFYQVTSPNGPFLTRQALDVSIIQQLKLKWLQFLDVHSIKEDITIAFTLIANLILMISFLKTFENEKGCRDDKSKK